MRISRPRLVSGETTTAISMINIRLSAPDAAEAKSAARSNSAQFVRRRGAYGDNSFERHFIGSLGEWASYRWLRDSGLPAKPLFRYSSMRSRSDIEVGGWQVEVKTWRTETLAEYGVSLSSSQLTRIIGKADLLLICEVLATADPIVAIHGWAFVHEAVATAIPIWTTRTRGDLLIKTEAMRPPSDFLGVLQTPQPPRTSPWPRSAFCSQSHSAVAGHCWVCAGGPTHRGQRVITSDHGQGFFHLRDLRDVATAHGANPFSGNSILTSMLLGEAILNHQACPFCFSQR